jgi:CcmD family protein
MNANAFIRVIVLSAALFCAPTPTIAAQQPASTPPASTPTASTPPASTPPASTPPASAQPQPKQTPPRAAQDEFVPVEDLPESEKLPAAPFLIAAYSIVWLVLLVYVWSLWRRLTHVEHELKQAVQSVTRE